MTMIPTRIVRRTDWADGLATLELDHSPPFTAGQFFNLGLQVGEHVVRRSYSAASAPGRNLEFFVSRVTDGGLSPQLFERVEGQQVLLDITPLGFFTLNEVPPTRHLWLVATGTGLGPYISMLRSGELNERFERVILVHGTRSASHLAYAQELFNFAKADPRFYYLPTLSGVGQTFLGALSGRITSVWDDGSLEQAAGPFDEECHMLLCGNPKMIEDMVMRLKGRGFEKHRRRQAGHFNFEKYW